MFASLHTAIYAAENSLGSSGYQPSAAPLQYDPYSQQYYPAYPQVINQPLVSGIFPLFCEFMLDVVCGCRVGITCLMGTAEATVTLWIRTLLHTPNHPPPRTTLPTNRCLRGHQEWCTSRQKRESTPLSSIRRPRLTLPLPWTDMHLLRRTPPATPRPAYSPPSGSSPRISMVSRTVAPTPPLHSPSIIVVGGVPLLPHPRSELNRDGSDSPEVQHYYG